jgi:hypothetical protein
MHTWTNKNRVCLVHSIRHVGTSFTLHGGRHGKLTVMTCKQMRKQKMLVLKKTEYNPPSEKKITWLQATFTIHWQYTVISCLIGKQSKMLFRSSGKDLGNCCPRPFAKDNSFPCLLHYWWTTVLTVSQNSARNNCFITDSVYYLEKHTPLNKYAKIHEDTFFTQLQIITNIK